jgi:pentatricopeptide repeat protein
MSTAETATGDVRTVAYPYPGLRPFGTEEAEIFFGREEHVDDLLLRLEKKRFLGVVGPSGCGKSSLIRAGVIPALHAGLAANAGTCWQIAVMRPGLQPLKNLAAALKASAGPAQQAFAEDDGFLDTVLARGPLGLVDSLCECQFDSGLNLLLVVDQFEELFRFSGEDDGSRARAFVNLLLASATTDKFPIYVILTIRSDFLGNCPVFRGLPEALNDSQYLTPRLNRDQQRAAIENPALLFQTTVLPDVVNRILNEMGADPDQLPLMQHLLMRMWRTERMKVPDSEQPIQLTLDTYKEVGGLHGCVSSHANRTYQALNADEQRMAELVFRRLTDVTPGLRLMRRPCSHGELCRLLAPAAHSPERAALRKVIDAFRRSGRSFVMPPPGEELTDESAIDISHESVIRQWDRLKDWALDEHKITRVRKMIEEKTARWKEHRNDKKYLLFGVELAEASALRDKYPAVLRSPETELVAESVKHEQEEVRRDEGFKYMRKLNARKNVIAGLVAILFLVTAALAITAFVGKQTAEQAQKDEHDARLRADQETRRADVAAKNAEKAALIADHERGLAEEERKKAREYAVRLAAANGARLLEENDVSGALLWYAEALARDPQNPEGHRRRLGIGMELGPRLTQVWLPRGKVTHAEFSPDGKHIFTATEDGVVKLWTPDSDDPVCQENHKSRIRHIEFNRDGKRFITVDEEGNCLLWNTVGGKSTSLVPKQGGRILHGIFSPKEDLLVTAGTRGAQVWDLSPPKESRQLGKEVVIRDAAFSPDGKRVVLAADSEDSPVLEVATGKVLSSLRHFEPVRQVAFSPDGNFIATINADRFGPYSRVGMWDAQSGKALSARLEDKSALFKDKIIRLSFSPDGKWLLTVGEDLTPKLWRIPRQEARPQGARLDEDFNSPQGWTWSRRPFLDNVGMNSGSFSKDGRHLVIAATDNTARLGFLDSDFSPFPPLSHRGRVVSASFSPDGRWVLTAGEETVRLWDLQNTILLNPAIEGARGVRLATVDPEGDRVALVNGDETVWICDLATGKRTVSHSFLKDGIRNIQLLKGDRLITSDDRKWRVWDVKSGKELSAFPRESEPSVRYIFSPGADFALKLYNEKKPELWKVGHSEGIELQELERISQAVFSPDARRLAMVAPGAPGVPGAISLWEVESGRGLRTLRVPAPVSPDRPQEGILAFSPDSRSLVLAGQDNKALVWNVSSGELIAEFKNSARVIQCEFTRDGGRLAIASEDKTARIWDLARRVPVTVLSFPRRVLMVDFSPDGKYVAGVSENPRKGSEGDLVQVWNTATSEPVTPPLPHPLPVTYVQFSPDGTRLITTGDRRSVRVWNLNHNQHLEDKEFIAFAQLKNGHKISETSVRAVPLKLGELFSAWAMLKQRISRDAYFSVSQLQKWHWRQTLDCEEVGQWEAALWHLGRLLDKGDLKLQSDILACQGDLKRRLERFDEALKDYERAAKQPTPVPSLPWDVATLYRVRGEARLAAGFFRMDQTTAIFEDFKNCGDRLLRLMEAQKNHPLTVLGLDSLAKAYIGAGRAFLRGEGVEPAQEAFKEAQVILKALPEAGTISYKEDLLDINRELGKECLRQGQTFQAKNAFANALELQESLDKVSSKKHRDLQERTELLEKLGRVSGDLGETQKALDYYKKALDLVSSSLEDFRDKKGKMADVNAQLGFFSLRIGNTAGAYKYYREGIALHQARLDAEPNNLTYQENVAYSYRPLIEVCVRRGDVSEAHELFRKMRDICESLEKNPRLLDSSIKYLAFRFGDMGSLSLDYLDNSPASRDFWAKSLELLNKAQEKNPSDSGLDENTAQAHEWLADICEQLGDGKEARKHADKTVEIRESILNRDPRSAEAKRHLTDGYLWRGRVLLALDDSERAEESYDKYLGLLEALAKADPQNAYMQGLLANAYLNYGSAKLTLGEPAAAVDFLRKGVALRERLLEMDPINMEAKRSVALAVSWQANASFRVGDLAGARKDYDQYLKLRRKLDEIDPKNASVRKDLAQAYGEVGLWHCRMGDAKVAVDRYSESLRLREKLADEHKTSSEKRALALGYRYLGSARMEQGDFQAALREFEKALRIDQVLAEADKENLLRQTDLATDYSSLGSAELQDANLPAARKQFQQCLAILEALDAQKKLVSRDNQKMLRNSKRLLAVAEKGEKVLEDLSVADKEPPEWAAELLIFRAVRQVAADQNDQALETAERLQKLGQADPNRLFDLARCYARMGRVVVKGRGPELEGPEQKLATDYFRRATGALNQAVNAGYKDWGALLSDADLDIIRSESAYRELVRQAPVRPVKALLPDLNITPKDGAQKLTLVFKDSKAQIVDELTVLDPKATRRPGSYSKTYSIQLAAGKTYQIDMKKISGLDPYLFLEDDMGKQLAFDDDSGGFPDARIVFACTRDGTYRIIATTYERATGRYSLTVQQK